MFGKLIIVLIGAVILVSLIVIFLTTNNYCYSCDLPRSNCKLATANCQDLIATGVYSNYSECVLSCVEACKDSNNKDLISKQIVDESSCANKIATACYQCSIGNVTFIRTV